LERGLAILLVCTMISVTALGGCLEGNKPAENRPPVARISTPTTGSVFDTGVSIDFNGSASYDPEKKPINFTWYFGDNTTGTGNPARHFYSIPGKYSVGLEVSDGKKKGSDRIELNIKQANRSPTIRFNASNLTASNEELVEFNATATTDADNDTLTFIWDFGDNTTAQGPVVTHRYPNVGKYNVTLNVSDGKSSSTATQVETVYQANRPPAPVLRATPLVAFIGDGIEFNASASTDPDNDSLLATWDFGDGSSGNGLAAIHAFSATGNYTATATVSDGELSRTANLIVTIVPRATILLDWNQTDYGYVIRLDADGTVANLSAVISDSSGKSDKAPVITALGGRDFRLGTHISPVKGLVLTVSVSYWGNSIATRKLTIYENTPMPDQNCTVQMNATTSEHKLTSGANESKDEWFNVSGTVEIVVRGEVGEYSLHIVKAANEQATTNGTNYTTKGKTDIGGWFNQTLVWGATQNESIEFISEGNSTTTDHTGALQSTMHSRAVQRLHDHNNTFLSQYMTAKMGIIDFTMSIETLGIEDKANGNGVIFSCLKLKSNITVDAVVEMMPGNFIHLKQFNETLQWTARDDRFENSTIYVEYVQNTYTLNDTSGVWTLMNDSSGSGSMFLDENGDGVYNPDPAPMTMDAMFDFQAFIPRELSPGDRIVFTNEHGVKMVLNVSGSGIGDGQMISGVFFLPLVVNITYSNAVGNVTGSTILKLVASGNLTGLPLYSIERRSWKHEDTAETSTNSFFAVTIRED
jgi:PKD repeat protein